MHSDIFAFTGEVALEKSFPTPNVNSSKARPCCSRLFPCPSGHNPSLVRFLVYSASLVVECKLQESRQNVSLVHYQTYSSPGVCNR